MAVSETLALDVRQALNSIGQVDKALTDAAIGFQAELDDATVAVKVEETGVDEATQSLDRMNKELDETALKNDKAAVSAKRHDQAMTEVGRTALVAGAALAAAFAIAIKTTIDFDRQMSLVAAVTGETGKEFDKLRDAALEAGEATVFSATEAAAAQTELAKAGVSTADILGGGLVGALDLAAAGALGLEEAATIAAQAMTAFQLSGADVTRVADTLASGANKGVSSVSSLGEALGSVGPLANQFKLSLEQTVGTLALFEQNGIRGSEAGTNLRRILLQLAAPTKDAQEVLAKYNIDMFDAQGNFIGLAGAAEQLQAGLNKVGDETRQAAFDTIFGSFAIQGANVLYKEGRAGVEGWTEAVTDAGAAGRFSAIALDNLGGDLERLSGALETALIKSGSKATDVLRVFAGVATDAVKGFSALPGFVQTAAIAFAGLGAALLLVTGALAVTVPKFTQAKTALIDMGGAAATAGRNLGNMVRVGAGLAGLAAGLALVGTSAEGSVIGIASMAAAGAQLGAAFTPVGGALGALGGTLLGVGVMLAKGGQSVDEYRASISALSSELNGLAKETAAGRFLQALGFSDTLGFLAGDIKSITNEIAALSRTSPAAAKNVLEGLASSGVITAKQFLLLNDVVDKGEIKFKNHAARLAASAAANQALTGTTGAVTGALTAAEPAVSNITDAFDAADDAASGFSSVMDHIFGIFISAEKANLAFLDSLDGITKSFKENGATLDDTTEKGRKNRQAIITATEAAIAHADAIYRETGNLKLASVALGAHAQQLFDVAIQAGLSEEEALDYAAAILGIPPEARTNIHNTADLALAAAKILEDKYNDLDGRTVTTKVAFSFADTTNTQQQIIDELRAQGLLAGGGQVKAAARGRAVFGNGMYWVGEQGPELFRPTTPGRIISNPESMATAQGQTSSQNRARGGVIIENLHVAAPLPDPVAIGFEVGRRLRAEQYIRGA